MQELAVFDINIEPPDIFYVKYFTREVPQNK
jgi:hypothetical protein